MKKTIIPLLLLFFFSCSNTSFFRGPSSASSLDGTYLGYAKYGLGRKGPNKPAVRIYLQELEEERGSYNAVLLEYIDLKKMAPQYASSTYTPRLNKVIGYLNAITKKITAYRLSPLGNNKFEMRKLRAVNGKIIAANTTENSQLILSEKAPSGSPFQGAQITTSKDGESAPITFPFEGEEQEGRVGQHYSMAKLIYTKGDLDSTWRKKYLTGDYLAAYGKVDDKVLDLSSSNGKMRADFTINFKNGYDVKRKRTLHSTKRERIFTNRKSAYLKGPYTVTEPEDGMFLFEKMGEGATHSNSDYVINRIGLFIDVFDAQRSRNQDVVELVLLNNDDPEDFLMYYEHPENGEGDRE